MFDAGRQSIFVSCRWMGKQQPESAGSERVLTMRQHLRHSSIALERHIFHRNSLRIKEFLDEGIKAHLISFHTHDKYSDLLRETARQPQPPSLPLEDQEGDWEGASRQVHRQESLPSEFEAMLDKSLLSYEKTYQLFRGVSLLRRFGHLVGLQEEEEQRKSDVEQLSEQEQKALRRIKTLYRRYKVSNMYKSSVTSRIRKRYIERLVEKGYLREKNEIISLTA